METPTKLPLPPKTAEAEAELDPKRRYVRIGKGDTYWMEMTYHAALHTVMLERFAAKTKNAKSPRTLLRSLRGLKDESEFEAANAEAIERVTQVEPPITLAEVKKKGCVVVASLPGPEEDPIDLTS